MSLLNALRRKPQPAIFICYRRHGEGSGYGGRVADKLVRHFGPSQCFRDVENIEAGVDFVESITKAVDSCEVLVVVIGPDWATQTGVDSKPRIEDPQDFVRLEVAAALRRDIRVVPVLVGGAELPSEAELPEDLSALPRRQAHEFTDSRWDYDTDRLIATIGSIGIKGGQAARREALRQRALLGGALAALVAALVLGILLITRGGDSSGVTARPPDQQSEAAQATDPGGADRARELEAERARALEAELELERLKRQAAEDEKLRLEESAKEAAPAPRIPKIAGLWQDANYPTNGSQITQNGNRFDFTGWGYLPNGIQFRSAGNGTLTPDSFTSRYIMTYQTGLTSSGSCSGTVTADGARMQMSCTDTVLGSFPITSLRQ